MMEAEVFWLLSVVDYERRMVVVLHCWAAELHQNHALAPTPQKKRGKRKYAGIERGKKKGLQVEVRIIN